MVAKTNISVTSILLLGSTKLAEILIELAGTHKEVKKRLDRAVLAMGTSHKKYATTIKKQITGLLGKKDYFDNAQSKELAKSIDGIRLSIINDVSNESPVVAVELLKELLSKCNQAIEYADDNSNKVINACREVSLAWADIIANISTYTAQELAEELFQSITDDQYNITEGLVEKLSPSLGVKGLTILETLARKVIKEQRKDHDSSVSQLGKDNVIFMSDIMESFDLYTQSLTSNQKFVTILTDIADAKGDIDLYIEAEQMKPFPSFLSIAARLLQKNKPADALKWLDKTSENRRHEEQYYILRINILDRLGKKDQAQALRWDAFCNDLNPIFYVDYADNAPKEQQESIRQQAIAIAKKHEIPYLAIGFFIWLQDHSALKEIVLKIKKEFNFSAHRELSEITDFLATKEYDAAILLYQEMASYIVSTGQSSHYNHAVRYICKAKKCEQLLDDTPSLGIKNSVFIQNLKDKYSKKYTFWQALEKEQKASA